MRINLSLGAIASLQIVASLAVQLTVLRLVGAGHQTDAFIAAQAVPLVLLAVLSVSLQHVWQPRLAVLSGDRIRWREAQAAAQGQVLLVYGGAGAVLALLAFWWTPLLFPGFEPAQLGLVVSMTAPLFAASALNCHALLFTTALRAIDRFVQAELVALTGTLVLLVLVMAMVPRWGIQAAAWAALARGALVVATLHLLAQRPGLSLRRALAAGHVWVQLRPLVAGSSLYKTAPLIDRYWSTLAPAGGVTALSLVQMGMGAVGTVLERALAVPAAPQLARMVERRDFHAVRTTYRQCLRRVSVATLVVGAVIAVAYPVWNPMLALLVALPDPWATQTWLIALLLLGYMHVSASGTVVVAAFLALGDAKTPVRIGVVGFVGGALLKSAGFLVAGLPGLAAATSIYYICNIVAMCLFLERKLDAQLA